MCVFVCVCVCVCAYDKRVVLPQSMTEEDLRLLSLRFNRSLSVSVYVYWWIRLRLQYQNITKLINYVSAFSCDAIFVYSLFFSNSF